MADITTLILDTRQQGSNATFWDTNIYTPSPNKTIILICNGVNNPVTPPPIIPLVVGNGLAWTLVHTQLLDFDGFVDRDRLSVFRGISSSPTLGTTRVSYASLSLRQSITVLEFSNTDIGNFGADAIVGTPESAKFVASSGLNPSVANPLGDNPANFHLGILAYAQTSPNNSPGVSPGIGFSPLVNVPMSEGGGHFTQKSQRVLSPCDFNVTSDPELGIISIELRNATPAAEAGEPQIIGRPSVISGNLITP